MSEKRGGGGGERESESESEHEQRGEAETRAKTKGNQRGKSAWETQRTRTVRGLEDLLELSVCRHERDGDGSGAGGFDPLDVPAPGGGWSIAHTTGGKTMDLDGMYVTSKRAHLIYFNINNFEIRIF